MSTLIALKKELLADADTPVSAYLKLCGQEPCGFLLESGESVEHFGRYSVVAWDPLAWLTLERSRVVYERDGQSRALPESEFFDVAQKAMDQHQCGGLDGLPFVGSFLGYLGFDLVGLIEKLPAQAPSRLPTARLCFPSRYVVFDHLRRRMIMFALGRDEDTCRKKLADTEKRLAAHGGLFLKPASLSFDPLKEERFLEAVAKTKEYILAGDIFQTVISDRFTGRSDMDPLSVYRWLRVKSPSPYMFLLKYPDCQLVGSSPEMLVKTDQSGVKIRPIAGTRGRSSDPAKDLALEQEMLACPKERAEHVMLVDLARNDAGRVSRYGSVRVEPYMVVERYSHVMHMVSQVEGRLKTGLTPLDAFKAAFPAGTVSGAPKVRALEIINELEEENREVYAGAVGCFGPGGRMDTCIAIRMIQFEGDAFTVQVGAGIVADSQPEMELKEIKNKAAQSLAALNTAAEGLA